MMAQTVVIPVLFTGTMLNPVGKLSKDLQQTGYLTQMFCLFPQLY